jgi:alkylated DNA nucleotide flippase Atl1
MLYIPSVSDVFEAISAIPIGKTMTIVELRNHLARNFGADVACPAKTIGYWKWLAYAAEEEGYASLPWWRVLKDGQPSRHMPGGIETQQSRLDVEKK